MPQPVETTTAPGSASQQPACADSGPAAPGWSGGPPLCPSRSLPSDPAESAPFSADGLVGDSPALRELVRQLRRIASSDVPVCLLGESGSGKELVARAIHARSGRPGPFVALNCAAIPSTLQDAELFGFERGAFTGAVRQQRGCIEQASSGTLFLDEVGEMSASTQVLLLRTLQERAVRRIGGHSEIAVDTRVLSATHRDLNEEVRSGRFRQDLYFRLVVYPLRVPPLRERIEDVPRLAEHFLRKFSGTPQRVFRISNEAMAALVRYTWPGNVRELENVIRRALLTCDGPELGLCCFPAELGGHGGHTCSQNAPPPSEADEVLPLREVEHRAIVAALRATHGRVAEAAQRLQVGRATLYRRIQQLGISLPTLLAIDPEGAPQPPRSRRRLADS